ARATPGRPQPPTRDRARLPPAGRGSPPCPRRGSGAARPPALAIAPGFPGAPGWRRPPRGDGVRSPSTPACAERPPPSPAHAASSDRRRRAAAPARESGPRAAAPRRGGPSAEKEGGGGSGGSPATRPAETAGRMAEGAGARSKGVARLAIEAVLGLDVADRPALGAHHHRVGLRAPLEEAHAPEEVARGHAGRGEHHVAARELLQ